ncbi:MAG: DUF697 domain-containing protein [Cyanobacteria bacterium J06629_19]
MQLKRPILVGGLGLSASLWLLNIVGHSPVGHALGDGSALMGAIALSCGIWLFKQGQKQGQNAELAIESPLALQTVDRTAVERVIAGVESAISTLIEELPEDASAEKSQRVWTQIEAQIKAKRNAIAQVLESIDRETLSIAVVGNKSTGKSTVISQLRKQWQPAHTHVTSITETAGENAIPAAQSDLVLFVTAGDLTQSELQHLQTLLKAGYRLHIAFNKQDQLTPEDRGSVLQRIQTRVEALGIGVSAIAANPNTIKVRRHQEDGTIQKSTEQPAAQLTSLTDRLTQLANSEAKQLILATALRQAKALKVDTQKLLNAQRKQKALPIIEQMQWIAAGSAFASPLPSLDLLASTAINAQLIVDLGAVYGQTFSLEQGKKAASTLAELLVKLGLVELSTQAFGSLLKTHAATYVAGGALQGVSAAYLTRTVGLSLVEFFEEQSHLPEQKRQFAFSNMGDRLQAIFKATKQDLGLQSFVKQALTHLPAANKLTTEKTVAA